MSDAFSHAQAVARRKADPPVESEAQAILREQREAEAREAALDITEMLKAQGKR
jgi:hypothetical protein